MACSCVNLFWGNSFLCFFNKHVYLRACSLRYKKSDSSHAFCMKHLLMMTSKL